MKYYVITIILIIGSMACKQGISTEEQMLHDKVMIIHDEVMPQVKTINKRELALEKLLKSADVEEDSTALRTTLADLKVAYDLMFEWMDNFKSKSKLPEGTDYMNYLKNEELRIKKVRDAMLSSINDADALIQKLK